MQHPDLVKELATELEIFIVKNSLKSWGCRELSEFIIGRLRDGGISDITIRNTLIHPHITSKETRRDNL